MKLVILSNCAFLCFLRAARDLEWETTGHVNSTNDTPELRPHIYLQHGREVSVYVLRRA